MNNKKVKAVFMPIIYCGCIIVFLFGLYMVRSFTNNILFSNEDNLEYVDGEITDSNITQDIPVVSIPTLIGRPYVDPSVKVAKKFYDYESSSEEQEDAIIFYEGTYMQNSGIDYVSDNSFDVVSILNGTVISVENNDILGTVVEIRHSNNLISVYQSLSDVVLEVDMEVVQGQIIAKSGTSNVNKELENHLHFELYHNGEVVNPENYFDKNIDEL